MHIIIWKVHYLNICTLIIAIVICPFLLLVIKKACSIYAMQKIIVHMRNLNHSFSLPPFCTLNYSMLTMQKIIYVPFSVLFIVRNKWGDRRKLHYFASLTSSGLSTFFAVSNTISFNPLATSISMRKCSSIIWKLWYIISMFLICLTSSRWTFDKCWHEQVDMHLFYCTSTDLQLCSSKLFFFLQLQPWYHIFLPLM